MPRVGNPAASTALPQPPRTSQNVPRNSADSFAAITHLAFRPSPSRPSSPTCGPRRSCTKRDQPRPPRTRRRRVDHRHSRDRARALTSSTLPFWHPLHAARPVRLQPLAPFLLFPTTLTKTGWDRDLEGAAPSAPGGGGPKMHRSGCSRWRRRRSDALQALERFLEGPQIELVRPGGALLGVQEPVGV